MKMIKITTAALTAGTVFLSAVLPAIAAQNTGETSEKEEVIYINLDNKGDVKDVYAVNIFGTGSVTDYGDYSSVKMLNTTEDIKLDGDEVTFNTSAKKAYYQGTMKNTQIPWNISLKYFLDGKEYAADELAGKSGKLEIKFNITENKNCRGTFYDDYALQAAVTFDTNQCSNISAKDATIANVGNKKQLTYTILPGEGIDTEISLDVTDFEMAAVSINGIHLNMNVDVDDTELRDEVSELIEAVEALDNGAVSLSDGTGELKGGTTNLVDGAKSLHSGVEALDDGVVTLAGGLDTVQDGLERLNAQSGALTGGSAQVKEALVQIQTAINSISVTDKDLSVLSEACGQVKEGIESLYDGAKHFRKISGTRSIKR